MSHSAVSAQLMQHASCPGIEEAIGYEDGWQVRDGAHWLITHEDTAIITRRIDPSGQRLFAEQHTWTTPAPGTRGYASPARGNLLFNGPDVLSALAPDGTLLWRHEHPAWEDENLAQGASALTPDGRYVIATLCGPHAADEYAGDVCAALDAHTGELLAQATMPAYSAGYMLQHLATATGPLLLTAAQGQEEHLSLLVTFGSDGLSLSSCDVFDAPFTGSSSRTGDLLDLALGGEQLTRWKNDSAGTYRPAAGATAAATLPVSGQQFVLRPGYVDDHTVIAPAADKDDWAPERSTHYLLDGQTLQLRAEVTYPFPVSPDPVALGDGTWLTAAEDEVFRWRATI
ncbi:hypothetical protein ADL21_00740 [Streptomyces albus subsp. albus]|nr:hypothetical protein ADL21_00740 [Streptomyces albus subsp. albus]